LDPEDELHVQNSAADTLCFRLCFERPELFELSAFLESAGPPELDSLRVNFGRPSFAVILFFSLFSLTFLKTNYIMNEM